MEITEKAVEAAAMAVSLDWEHHVPGMRVALKAAAPHLALDRVKGTSHQCEAALSIGRCILPLEHNPIVDGLPHMNGRGELFNLGESEQSAPRPVIDREAAIRAIETVSSRSDIILGREYVENYADVFADAVVKLARPMPTREQIAEALRGAELSGDQITDAYVTADEADTLAGAVLALLNGSES